MKKNIKNSSHCDELTARKQSHEIATPYGLAMTEQTGRSMVEMLGVLAVIGVLSVGGVAMYTSAMNKHRANEILNEASKRAASVAAQISMGGKEAPATASAEMIGEFTNPSDYVFKVGKKNANQFNITITATDTDAYTDICTQMKAAAGTNTPIRKINDACTELTFNNDMSTTLWASDFTTQADCQVPFSWCEELGKCQNAGDSCACPDENSSTSGTGDAITGTNCKCNSGYQLNATGTGCESALPLPYCATEGNCVFYEGSYTYNQAVQKCAENDKTLVMAADLGCEGETCPNIPEEFKLYYGARLGDPVDDGLHICLMYGDFLDLLLCASDNYANYGGVLCK